MRTSEETKRSKKTGYNPKVDLPAFKAVSIKEVLAAGGPDQYAVTKGVDSTKVNVSGFIKLSRKETDKWQAQLRKQG